MSSSSISACPCLSIVDSHVSASDSGQSTAMCDVLFSNQPRSTNEVARARIEAIVVGLIDDRERIKKDFSIAVASGNSKKIEELVASPLFTEIGRNDFERALIQGLKASSSEGYVGQLEVVKALLKSSRWQEMSHEVLERVLFLLASREEAKWVETIFQSLRLKKDNANLAAATLFLGQSLGCHKVVKVIRSIDPSIEITSTIAGDVFIKLARQGQAKAVKEIIQSDHFKEVSEESLNQAFFEGSLNSRWNVMRVILGSGRVRQETIYKAFFFGRFFFSREVIDAMRAMRAKVQANGAKKENEKEALTSNPKDWKAMILTNRFGELYELRKG